LLARYHCPLGDADITYGALGASTAGTRSASTDRCARPTWSAPHDTSDTTPGKTEIDWPTFRANAGQQLTPAIDQETPAQLAACRGRG